MRHNTIAPNRGAPPERPDPCWVCGEPVSFSNNEYRDRHDDCAGKVADSNSKSDGGEQ